MRDLEIITSALRRALAGEDIGDLKALFSALRGTTKRGEELYVGLKTVKVLLEYIESDLQAQLLLAQVAAKQGGE